MATHIHKSSIDQIRTTDQVHHDRKTHDALTKRASHIGVGSATVKETKKKKETDDPHQVALDQMEKPEKVRRTKDGLSVKEYADKTVIENKNGVSRQENPDGSAEILLPTGYLIHEENGQAKALDFEKGTFYPVSVQEQGDGGNSHKVYAFHDGKYYHNVDGKSLNYVKVSPETSPPPAPDAKQPPVDPKVEASQGQKLAEGSQKKTEAPSLKSQSVLDEALIEGSQSKEAVKVRQEKAAAMEALLGKAAPEEKATLQNLMMEAGEHVQAHHEANGDVAGRFAFLVDQAHQKGQFKNKEIHEAAKEYMKADIKLGEAQLNDRWSEMEKLLKQAPPESQRVAQEGWNWLFSQKQHHYPGMDLRREAAKLSAAYGDGPGQEAAGKFLARDNTHKGVLTSVYGMSPSALGLDTGDTVLVPPFLQGAPPSGSQYASPGGWQDGGQMGQPPYMQSGQPPYMQQPGWNQGQFVPQPQQSGWSKWMMPLMLITGMASSFLPLMMMGSFGGYGGCGMNFLTPMMMSTSMYTPMLSMMAMSSLF